MELLTSTLMLRGKGQLLLDELKTKVEIAIFYSGWRMKDWKSSLAIVLGWYLNNGLYTIAFWLLYCAKGRSMKLISYPSSIKVSFSYFYGL